MDKWSRISSVFSLVFVDSRLDLEIAAFGSRRSLQGTVGVHRKPQENRRETKDFLKHCRAAIDHRGGGGAQPHEETPQRKTVSDAPHLSMFFPSSKTTFP